MILDFDATDDPVHGNQEGRFFHGYYDRYCFLPLYVFCAQQLLVSYLRPASQDGARHAWAILALLVKRLRQAWPKVKIVFRGDSGFCRHRMLDWCDRHEVVTWWESPRTPACWNRWISNEPWLPSGPSRWARKCVSSNPSVRPPAPGKRSAG